jgi:hypothetical protein
MGDAGAETVEQFTSTMINHLPERSAVRGAEAREGFYVAEADETSRTFQSSTSRSYY